MPCTIRRHSCHRETGNWGQDIKPYPICYHHCRHHHHQAPSCKGSITFPSHATRWGQSAQTQVSGRHSTFREPQAGSPSEPTSGLVDSNSRLSSVSPSHTGVISVYGHSQLFMWVLGFELRSLYLHGQHILLVFHNLLQAEH